MSQIDRSMDGLSPATLTGATPIFLLQSTGEEAGARGPAPTLYFNDPNKHLIEIRTYGK
jgi:hypothetical protein